MDNTTTPAMAAVMVPLVCTFAILALTVFWATMNHPRRRLRIRAPLTGRRAAPYWYTPTGRQDERGITAARAAAGWTG